MRIYAYANISGSQLDRILARKDVKAMLTRIIAILLLLAAVLSAGVEGLQWISTGHYNTLTAGELWQALNRGSLNYAAAIIANYMAPWVWDPVLLSTLTLPAWSMLGVPALFLMWYAPLRPHPRFLKRRYFFRPFGSGGGRGTAA